MTINGLNRICRFFAGLSGGCTISMQSGGSQQEEMRAAGGIGPGEQTPERGWDAMCVGGWCGIIL